MCTVYRLSHPVWVCGLKLPSLSWSVLSYQVTPCMGVWIETDPEGWNLIILGVTPCMGVWIETSHQEQDGNPRKVTPCMGVWIETIPWMAGESSNPCHTLYGCVD